MYVGRSRSLRHWLLGMKESRNQNPIQRAALMSERASKRTDFLAKVSNVLDKGTPFTSFTLNVSIVDDSSCIDHFTLNRSLSLFPLSPIRPFIFLTFSLCA